MKDKHTSKAWAIFDETGLFLSLYQVLAVEQVSVDAKEGGNDYCIYLAVEQVYYT